MIPRRYVASEPRATTPTRSQAVASITLPLIAQRSRSNAQGCGHLLLWNPRPACPFGIFYSHHPCPPFRHPAPLLRVLASRRPGVSSLGRWDLLGRKRRRTKQRKSFRNLPGFGSSLSDRTLLTGAAGSGANRYPSLGCLGFLGLWRPGTIVTVFLGALPSAVPTCGSTAAISRRTSAT